MDWINMAQGRDKGQALVNTIMNFQFPYTVRNFLTSWETTSFSRTLFQGLSLSVKNKSHFASCFKSSSSDSSFSTRMSRRSFELSPPNSVRLSRLNSLTMFRPNEQRTMITMAPKHDFVYPLISIQQYRIFQKPAVSILSSSAVFSLAINNTLHIFNHLDCFYAYWQSMALSRLPKSLCFTASAQKVVVLSYHILIRKWTQFNPG